MKHLIVVVAFAATTAAPSVMATVYANASLSNIQYKLVDLDVNDGINPSVTFTPSYSYSTLSGFISNNNSISDSFNQNSTLNSLTSGAVSDSLNSASASINYNDSYATNLQASGSTLGNTSGTYSYFQGQSIDQQYYTLSPNTRLELSADSNLSVETTSSSAYEYGFAINQSFFYDLNNTISSYFYTQLYSDYFDPKTLSEMKSLSGFIDNISSQESNGYYSNYTYVYGQTLAEPSAVPVPAALPLMASALGAFGIVRRRNKAKASLKI